MQDCDRVVQEKVEEAARDPARRGTWAHPHAARVTQRQRGPHTQDGEKKTKPSKIKPISRYQTKALRTHPSGDSKEVWTVFATAPAGESFAGADDA